MSIYKGPLLKWSHACLDFAELDIILDQYTLKNQEKCKIQCKNHKCNPIPVKKIYPNLIKSKIRGNYRLITIIWKHITLIASLILIKTINLSLKFDWLIGMLFQDEHRC